MAHFASVDWNNPSGRVAGLENESTTYSVQATGSSVREGTDLLTYAVKRTGLYRVTAVLKVDVVSDSATSHTLVSQVSYNNGTAVASTDITTGLATITKISAKTDEAVLNQQMPIFAVSGTNIVMSVLHTINGAPTATLAGLDIFFAIEAV